MPNGDPDPPSVAAQVAQDLKEPPPRLHKKNDINVGQSQSPNPPETLPPPPDGTPSTTRAPEHLSLPERYQAIRRIHTLESHNAKLYEDNCRLVNAVNMLNERLVFTGAPQNTQALADMQDKLHTSEGSRILINRKYQDLLQSSSAGSAQRHLYEELQAVQGAYTSLDKEYRLLADKYTRLKVAAQQQLQGPGRLVPVARPEFTNTAQFRAYSHPSPTSAISPDSSQSFAGQHEVHQRRHSESIMAQPSLHSSPTPIIANLSAHLPAPPPGLPLPTGQISPTGFPVHASVPAASLLIPHRLPIAQEPRSSSRLLAVTHPLHNVQEGTSEKPNAVLHLRRHCGESADTANKEAVSRSMEIPAPATLTSSPRPPKRRNSEPQPSVSTSEKHKKPRTEGEADRPTAMNADTQLTIKTLVSPTSSNPQDALALSGSDSAIRSYQDCVNLIFEQDADVGNGVFCGLCLDRYEAKMIPEPPDILVQPGFDLLVRHCMTEHPTVWDGLRRRA